MVFNTATVGSAVTPAVIQTFISHYLNRKPLAQKPTAHISYDEGLNLIRRFLLYASHHTVEDIQRFTSQWVPCPTWVKVDDVTIAEEYITKSAEAIQEQLGHHGIEKVGGKTWWQWRRPGSELKAEWIEMRADYHERKRTSDPGKRVMLYVHGGAYFFGSVDEHRYQMQRHARKLKARVFARRHSLTMCSTISIGTTISIPLRTSGLPCCVPIPPHCSRPYDHYSRRRFCRRWYGIEVSRQSLYSLAKLTIESMLVVLRDRGIPLPAGAVLISPWVDLTHSFPSVAGDNPLDYIPPHGFHQKPSPSWPPPTTDDMLAIEESMVKKLATKEHVTPQGEADAVQGFHVDHNLAPGTQNDTAATGTTTNDGTGPAANTVPGSGHDLSIMIDGNLVQIKDQIQMYASNQLMSHPLVSPILQPSLGGLPPLLIMVGGGEMLRDEQIYVAHKAANPSKYPPGDAFLDESPHDHNRNQVNRWKPTDVQLQVWEDLCHVAPTLSFTRPAKYMYRSIAQFGAWALARAQKTEIEIQDDDDVSVISQSSTDDEDEAAKEKEKRVATPNQHETGQVGKAGDALPPFKNHMIRQRIDRHGNTYHLEHESELPGCNVPASEIGVIKQGPVKKWMAAKREWDTKFASSKRRVQKQRAKEMAKGYQQFGAGEVPPPSALAGRRKTGENLKEEKKSRSMGMSLWALWGSKHDEKTMQLEEKADGAPETAVATSMDGAGARPLHDTKTTQGKNLDRPDYSRSRSRRRIVRDEHQADMPDDVDENTPAAVLLAKKAEAGEPSDPSLAPNFMAASTNRESDAPSILIRVPTNEQDEFSRKQPKAGGLTFPFSLKGHNATASMTTLTSAVGVPPADDVRIQGVKDSGIKNHAPGAEIRTSVDGRAKGKEKEVVNGGAVTTASATQGGGAATPETGAKVVENGEVVSAERPPLETFVSAAEILPTSSAL
ncbi:AB hydrolase superfamily protein [Lachnellula suecica]|uniref:AB hydrolase superfamily protein n=1 Tax=Lachnellula suecica TaxID=602035 RepID=A0A8T9CRT5_9HELO|nr:AB hydrolase superfamily protein [Lachnellula suecica]